MWQFIAHVNTLLMSARLGKVVFQFRTWAWVSGVLVTVVVKHFISWGWEDGRKQLLKTIKHFFLHLSLNNIYARAPSQNGLDWKEPLKVTWYNPPTQAGKAGCFHLLQCSSCSHKSMKLTGKLKQNKTKKAFLSAFSLWLQHCSDSPKEKRSLSSTG